MTQISKYRDLTHTLSCHKKYFFQNKSMKYLRVILRTPLFLTFNLISLGNKALYMYMSYYYIIDTYQFDLYHLCL